VRRGESVVDRGGVHANIGLFFSQFESVNREELLQRLFDPALPLEGDLETLFRGDPQYTLEQRRDKLDHVLRAFDTTVPLDLEAQFYHPEAAHVLQAMVRDV
jgi:hypothetical protein